MILTYIGRSGCEACDRSEAGYQLTILDRKTDALNGRLRTLEG